MVRYSSITRAIGEEASEDICHHHHPLFFVFLKLLQTQKNTDDLMVRDSVSHEMSHEAFTHKATHANSIPLSIILVWIGVWWPN